MNNIRTFLEQHVTSLQANLWYALVIAILAVVSILMLGYEFSTWANPAIVTQTQRLDIVIACIFLADFFLGLLFNTSMNTREYWKKNWLNLVSSIPITSDMIRALRILRILRAFRVIRAGMNFWFARNRFVNNKVKKD